MTNKELLDNCFVLLTRMEELLTEIRNFQKRTCPVCSGTGVVNSSWRTTPEGKREKIDKVCAVCS